MKKLICSKCAIEAKLIALDSYEYEKGIPLHNVPAFECPQCKEFVFTPKQVKQMERRASTF